MKKLYFLMGLAAMLLSSLYGYAQAILLTDSMHVPRVFHEIQPLGNNKFLVMGGRNTSQGVGFYIERSCEIYDATTNTWSMTDSLQYGRSQFTSVVTTGGKVLAIGGETTLNGPVGNTEVFDPATETWSIAGTAPLISQCDAVVTSSGEILVTRYTKYYKGTADGSSITDVTPPNHVSSGEKPNCIELNNGKIFCVGSQPSSNNNFGVEYDNFSATTTGFRNGGGTGNLVAPLPGGKILLAGPLFIGSRPSEIYDPATRTFTVADSFSRPMASDLMPMTDGRVAAMMQNDLFGLTGPGTKILEIYDPITDTWSQAAPHYIENTVGARTINIGNGKYLICGGVENFQSFNSGSRAAFIFDENGTPAVSLKETVRINLKLIRSGAHQLKIEGGPESISQLKELEIYNLAGQLLNRQKIDPHNPLVQIPSLPMGIYAVLLSNQSGQYVHRERMNFE